MIYPYQTTKIAATHRFPTYQLHAKSINNSLPAMTVMSICILEVMSWLRGRLSQHETLPNEICLPQPCEYESFDTGLLKSFRLNLGFSLDVVYSEKDKLWAFCLTEDDMGANIGTQWERKPVIGRNFETNIGFRIIDDYVEVGVQTVCSEPLGTTENCEVFRPSVVKALYKNKNVGLRQVLNITDIPIEISTAKELQRIRDAASDSRRDLPVVIITQPAAVEKPPEITGLNTSFKPELLYKSSPQNQPKNRFSQLKMDLDALEIKVNASKVRYKEVPQLKAEKQAIETTRELIIPDTIDIEKTAEIAASFAFICSAGEDMFEDICTTFCLKLSKGDIIIIYPDGTNEIFRFSEFSDKLREMRRSICAGLNLYPMCRNIDFGNVVFASDARIMDYKNRRSEKITLDEENALLKAELTELNTKMKKAEESIRNITSNAEEIRRQAKQITVLQQELDYERAEKERLAEKCDRLSNLAAQFKPTVDFYRKKAQSAAYFPQDKGMIAQWAEGFSNTIIIHKNAVASLKKYPRPVNIEVLCDGLYFLHGYGLYRQGKISSSELELYAEQYSWEVQSCGKEALKMFRADYSIPMESGSRELNLHIKYGVNPKHWIRIYFYFDDDLQRVVIGYMPDHLPTVADKT